MKYVTLLAALVLMIACGRTANAQAYPTGSPGAVCNATNNLEGYFAVPIDHDTCTLLINTAEHQNGAQAVATCKLMQNEGALGDMTIGECVRGFKSAHDFGATSVSLEVFGVMLLGWVGWKVLRRRSTHAIGSAAC